MDNVARRHHYLPRSYLAGFTDTGASGGELYVFDFELRKVVGPKSTRGIAYEPDWHAIEGPGTPPDLLERAFAKFEDSVARTIRHIGSTLEVTSDDLNTLIGFVALTAVRVPRFRAGVTRQLEMETGRSFAEAVTEPANWQSMMRFLPGADLGWSAEDCELFMRGDRRVLANSGNYHMFALLLAQGTIFELLGDRIWSLCVAEEDAGDYICSDNPVGLVHSPARKPYVTPFFGERDTVLTFPLTRRLALVGRYSGDGVAAFVQRRWVALTNFQTLLGAWRYLYGPEKDFVCLSEDGGFGGADEVFSHLRPREMWEFEDDAPSLNLNV